METALLCRLDSYCFKRWFYTNTKNPLRNTTNRFISVCIHISAFSGPEQREKAAGSRCQAARPLLGPCRAEKQQHQSQSPHLGFFCAAVRFPSRPRWSPGRPTRPSKPSPTLQRGVGRGGSHPEGLLVLTSILVWRCSRSAGRDVSAGRSALFTHQT